MSDLLKLVVLATGVAMSASWFVQTYRILKRKYSDDLALTPFVVVTVGMVVFLVYARTINDFPLTVAYVLGLVGALSVVLATVKYRRKK